MKKKSFVPKSTIGKLKLNKVVISDLETANLKGGRRFTAGEGCIPSNGERTCEGVTSCGCFSWPFTVCGGGG